jgi:hypothetical protein
MTAILTESLNQNGGQALLVTKLTSLMEHNFYGESDSCLASKILHLTESKNSLRCLQKLTLDPKEPVESIPFPHIRFL